MIKSFLRWYKRRQRWKSVPRHYANIQYDMHNAAMTEKLMMRSGIARTPQEARRILNQYDATTFRELLDRMPIKRQKSERWRLLFARMFGELPYKPRLKYREPLFVEYQYEQEN